MPKFILTGNGPCLNRGCEAILRTTVAMLEREFSGASFLSCPHYDCSIPDRQTFSQENLVHKPFHAGATNRWQRAALRCLSKIGLYPKLPFLRELADSDAVLSLGGDNFTIDYAQRVARYQLDVGRYVLSKGKPFIIWGASIGPFSKSPEFEQYAREQLQAVSLITARDPLTVEYLASIGVIDNVVKVSDPAFTMKLAQPSGFNADDYGLNEKPLGLNFSPLVGLFLGKEDWVSAVVKSVKALDSTIDQTIAFVPHVVHKQSDDYAFMKEIQARLGQTKNRVTILPNTLSGPELKWCLDKLDVFVGARTHATIGALSQTVPTVSIGYSMKSRGINIDLFGDDRWLIDSKQITPHPFVEKVTEILEHKQEVRQHLSQVMPAYREQAYAGLPALKNLIHQ